MTKQRTGTREEWPAARLELLEAEKDLTRRTDEPAQRWQELPWVRIPFTPAYFHKKSENFIRLS